MIGNAEFNGTFDLKVRTLTTDGAGNKTESVATVTGYGTVPCYIQTLPVKEEVVSDQIVHVKIKNVFCNVGASVVTTDHYIVLRSAALGISAVDYEIIDVSGALKMTVEKKV